MNLNDMRSKAYQSGKGESAATQPFKKVNEALSVLFADKSPTDRKDDGLIKVPVADNGAVHHPASAVTEKESVYRRVAKFLLLIGVDEAAKVLPHLTEAQTERIIPELASIRAISPEEKTAILEEFNGLLEQARARGGVGAAREILEKAYGTQKAAAVLERAVAYPDGTPFDYLADAEPERIAALLSDESDEVRALVLSRLAPPQAAAVITAMNADEQARVVTRLAKLQAISPEVIRRVDRAVHKKMLSQTAEHAEHIDGRSALADILRKMPAQAESGILDALSKSDPELESDVRKRLFTLDDILYADDRFMQETLRTMSDNDIAFLLAAKPDAFRTKIYANISSGRGDVILEQEQLLKPIRRQDCERVTAQFFDHLRHAYERGALRIHGRDDEEYVQ